MKWIEKNEPKRWISINRERNLAFSITEKYAPFGKYYKLRILLADGSQYEAKTQKSDRFQWINRAISIASGNLLDLRDQPELWSLVSDNLPVN